MYTCMYARMYVCMQVCMYACRYVCMYVCVIPCMYVCMCVCMYVCTYVRMYVCISAFWYVSWCNAVDLVWIGQTTQNLLRCFISSHCLRNSWFVGVPLHTCSWPCWLSLSHLLLQPRSLQQVIQAPCVSATNSPRLLLAAQCHMQRFRPTKVFWFPFLDTLGHMLLCHNIKALRRCSCAVQKQRRAHETYALSSVLLKQIRRLHAGNCNCWYHHALCQGVGAD